MPGTGRGTGRGGRAGQAAAAGVQAPGLTAIGEAALYGDLEAVEPQLEKGGEVNAVSAEGQTPLMLSFQPLLLPPAKSGADPGATRSFKLRQRPFFQAFESDAAHGLLTGFLYDGRDEDDAPPTGFDTDLFLGTRLALEPRHAEVLARL